MTEWPLRRERNQGWLGGQGRPSGRRGARLCQTPCWTGYDEGRISQRIREQEGRLAGAVLVTGDNGSLLTMGLQKGRLWEVEAAEAALLLKRGEAGEV